MAIKHTKGDVSLQALIDNLNSKVVKVGYFAHSHYPDGTPVAYVAAIHEHGSPSNKIPPRPTLHPAMTKAQGELRAAMLAGVQQSLKSGNLDAGLDTVGLVAQSKIRAAISELASPALQQGTIQARARRHSKGLASDKPLVDTGLMLRSVEYAVEVKQ